jgi:predicted transcriptional regulator
VSPDAPSSRDPKPPEQTNGPNQSANAQVPVQQLSPNNLRQHRVALGLAKTELAKAAKLSDKTIARVETAVQRYRMVTYTRILNALNRARRSEAQPPLTLEDVFPGL